MNGVFLHLTLREISKEFLNAYISEILIKDRILQTVCRKKAFFIYLFPDGLGMFVAKKMRSGFKRQVVFTAELRGRRITSVRQDGFKPVVSLGFRKDDEKSEIGLTILFYHDAPNFSLQTKQGRRSIFPRLAEKKDKKSVSELTVEQFRRSYMRDKAGLFEDLVKDYQGLDKYLARELTPPRIKKLHQILKGGKAQPRLISIMPLKVSLFRIKYISEFESFNTLYQHALTKYYQRKMKKLQNAERKRLIRNIQRRINRLQKKILTTEEIEHFRVCGELLLANLKKTKPGQKEIALINPYTDKQIVVPLDPLKSAQENAQEFFSRYKKLKRGQPTMVKKIRQLQKEIQAIKEEKMGIVEKTTKVERKVRKGQEPFRKFALASGSIVYVGKNARSNDELTFSFARPNDYFFHVRGFEGAHTILRAHVPRNQNPRKDDINNAARIAAYFSKAKSQKNVPVSYTQRKYLRKSKKGKAGTVTLMREKVLFVNPGLPNQSQIP